MRNMLERVYIYSKLLSKYLRHALWVLCSLFPNDGWEDLWELGRKLGLVVKIPLYLIGYYTALMSLDMAQELISRKLTAEQEMTEMYIVCNFGCWEIKVHFQYASQVLLSGNCGGIEFNALPDRYLGGTNNWTLHWPGDCILQSMHVYVAIPEKLEPQSKFNKACILIFQNFWDWPRLQQKLHLNGFSINIIYAPTCTTKNQLKSPSSIKTILYRAAKSLSMHKKMPIIQRPQIPSPSALPTSRMNPMQSPSSKFWWSHWYFRLPDQSSLLWISHLHISTYLSKFPIVVLGVFS